MESTLFENKSQIELMYKLSDFLEQLPEEEKNKIIDSCREIVEDLDTDEEEAIVEECRRLKKYREERETFQEYFESAEAQLRDHMGYSAKVNGLEVGETVCL